VSKAKDRKVSAELRQELEVVFVLPVDVEISRASQGLPGRWVLTVALEDVSEACDVFDQVSVALGGHVPPDEKKGGKS